MIDGRASTPHAPQALHRFDAAIAAVLTIAAAVARRNRAPDGWFLDDAWQGVAAQAPLGHLPVAGQTQPGFTALQWLTGHLFGPTDLVLVAIPLVAGVLGPPVLYLVLRHLTVTGAVAALTSSLLVVNDVHTQFSSHLKAYTVEVVVVLALAVAVTHLSPRRWGRRLALAWTVATVVLAATSSFSLVAAACAGIVVVVGGTGPRRWRLAAVGVQAVASAAILGWTRSTYNAEQVAANWDTWEGMIGTTPWPTLPVRAVEHLHRLVEAFAGWGGAVAAGVLVLAAAGLVVGSIRGPGAPAARFLALTVLAALVGSVVGAVPFGPRAGGFHRISLWLFPALAFGLAWSLDHIRTIVTGPDRRRVVDAAVGVGASVIVLTGVGDEVRFQPGSRPAVQAIMADLGPDDAVVIPRPVMYSFALDAHTPYRVVPQRDALVGFRVDFDDERLVTIPWGTSPDRALRGTGGAERIIVVNANLGRLTADINQELSVLLTLTGYEVEASERHGSTTVITWRRTD